MTKAKVEMPLLQNARANRKTLTDAEVRIWTELHRRAIGVHFRRQHPIGPYILDFACLALKLDIELDGSQHYEATEDDGNRDEYLDRKGWTVLRFTSHDALVNTWLRRDSEGDQRVVATAPLTASTPPSHPLGWRNVTTSFHLALR